MIGGNTTEYVHTKKCLLETIGPRCWSLMTTEEIASLAIESTLLRTVGRPIRLQVTHVCYVPTCILYRIRGVPRPKTVKFLTPMIIRAVEIAPQSTTACSQRFFLALA